MNLPKCLMLLFGTVVLSATAAPPQLTVPRLAGQIRIDGSGEDAAWQSLPWHGDFTLLNRAPKKPDYATRFKVAHDNHQLYFLVECADPPSGATEPKATARDGKVFNDDCVEIFIDPNYDWERFYHFAVNRANAVYDCELTQGGIIRYSPWNAEKLASAVTVQDKGWTLEMALPLVELGLEQDSGKMGINISRAVPKVPVEYSSFVPFTAGLAQPAKFAVAQLEKPELKHFAWKLRAPYDTKLVRRGGELHYEGKLHLENATGKVQFARMEQALKNGGSTAANAIMDDGVGKEYAFSLACDPARTTEFAVTVTDLRDGERLFARRFPLTIRYSPMTVTLTDPPYRDNIYADMKLDALKGAVTVQDSDCAALPVALTLTGADGKTVAETKIDKPGAFTLPVPALADGVYTLTAQAGDCRSTKTIRKLPRHPGEVRFDADRNMYVDGKMVLPYGWFSYTDLAAAQKAGYNIEFSYHGGHLHGENLRNYFDLRAKHGIKTALYCYPDSKLYSKDAMRKPLSRAEADLIRNRIRELRDHPGLLGWYLGDEIESAPALPARIQEIDAICHEEDPYHPTIILHNSAGGYLKYADSADILMPDIYPTFIEGGNAGKPISHVTKMLDIARNAGNRILWYTPQGFNYADFGRLGQRGPDFTELRNMHYQGLAGGVKGFAWYVWTGSECYPELMGGVAFLAQEARALSELYTHSRRCKALPSGAEDVLLYGCEVGSRSYRIAISAATEERSFSFPVNGKTYYTAGEEDAFTVRDGKLCDKLAKYQVKVYVSDETLARSFRIADSEKMIAEAAKGLHKPGNLAYTPVSKAEITVNIPQPGKKRPLWHLADGSLSRPLTPGPKLKVKPAVTMTFPKEVRAGRAVLYGRNLKSAVVEIERDGKWVKVADTVPAPAAVDPNVLDAKITAVEAKWPAESFRKIRFSDLKMAAFAEIELYEK